MSTVDSAIADRQREIDRHHRQIEVLEAEIRGLRTAAGLLLPGSKYSESQAAAPVTVNPAPGTGKSHIGGRQPGAISQTWRQILACLYHDQGQGFDQVTAGAIARQVGVPGIRDKDAWARLGEYIQHDYVEMLDVNLYRVTDHAAQRFGFEPRRQESSGWTTEPLPAASGPTTELIEAARIATAESRLVAVETEHEKN